MNNKLDLYPFLISRNQSKDYGVIVAPDFLAANELSALIQATQYERETESGTVIHCQVQYEEDHQRDFTLIFRVDTATQQDIGENTLDILKDLSNTSINLVVGVVSRGLIPQDDVRISDEYFQKVRQYITQYYRSFWNNQSNQVFRSHQLPNEDISLEFLQVRSISNYNVREQDSNHLSNVLNNSERKPKSDSYKRFGILFIIIILGGAVGYLGQMFFFH
jgi:hypothetical protein